MDWSVISKGRPDGREMWRREPAALAPREIELSLTTTACRPDEHECMNDSLQRHSGWTAPRRRRLLIRVGFCKKEAR
jgi:hypothetical protein